MSFGWNKERDEIEKTIRKHYKHDVKTMSRGPR